MITIAFYSYKGGVGKSMCALNLTTALSRMGFNVALVDMDFDSPSLHKALNQAPPGNAEPNGLAGFIRTHVKRAGTEWPFSIRSQEEFENRLLNLLNRDTRGLDLSIVMPPDHPLHKFVAKLSITNIEAGPRERPFGTIHFLAAGDPESPNNEFVRTALSTEFQMALTFVADTPLNRTLSPETYDRLKNFFTGIKDNIATLEPGPDFMFVDLRSGNQEMADTALSLWADLFLCMFNPAPENVEYTAALYGRLNRKTEAGETLSPAILPVLSRIPLSTNYVDVPNLLAAMSKAGIALESLPRVHSFPPAEIAVQDVFGLKGRPRICQLTEDYVLLLAHLFDKLGEMEKTQGEKFSDFRITRLEPKKQRLNRLAATIRERLNLPSFDSKEIKWFDLDRQAGTLLNPNDESRNVSFKHETFQHFLHELKAASEGAPGRLKVQDFAEALHVAGLSSGRRFGSSLAKHWGGPKRHEKSSYRGVVNEIMDWCYFDSDVGFGRFSLIHETCLLNGIILKSCTVTLKNSFLVPEDDVNAKKIHSHDLCDFLRGYISGVFEELFGGAFSTVHRIVAEEAHTCGFGVARTDNG